MVKVTIDIKGDKALQKKLKRAKLEMRDFRKELKPTMMMLEKFYSGPVFDSEGQATGSKWEKLSDKYAIAKRKKWGNKGILVASGKMKNSFKHRVHPTFGVLTNTKKYMKYHHTGTRKMPERRVMRLNDNIEKKIGEVFERELVKQLKKAFRG